MTKPEIKTEPEYKEKLHHLREALGYLSFAYDELQNAGAKDFWIQGAIREIENRILRLRIRFDFGKWTPKVVDQDLMDIEYTDYKEEENVYWFNSHGDGVDWGYKFQIREGEDETIRVVLVDCWMSDTQSEHLSEQKMNQDIDHFPESDRKWFEIGLIPVITWEYPGWEDTIVPIKDE